MADKQREDLDRYSDEDYSDYSDLDDDLPPPKSASSDKDSKDKSSKIDDDHLDDLDDDKYDDLSYSDDDSLLSQERNLSPDRDLDKDLDTSEMDREPDKKYEDITEKSDAHNGNLSDSFSSRGSTTKDYNKSTSYDKAGLRVLSHEEENRLVTVLSSPAYPYHCKHYWLIKVDQSYSKVDQY